MVSAAEPTRDPALADRLWVGYDPLALLPAGLALGCLSLAVWTGHWYGEDVIGLAGVLDRWVRFALAWGGWPAFVLVFLYRTVTYTYRLTDRVLLVDFGPGFRPVPPISLAEIEAVSVGGWQRRWLGVGWVWVRTSSGRVVRLDGVRRPEALAETLRRAANSARGSASM